LEHIAQVFKQKDANRRVYDLFEPKGGVSHLAQFFRQAPRRIDSQLQKRPRGTSYASPQ